MKKNFEFPSLGGVAAEGGRGVDEKYEMLLLVSEDLDHLALRTPLRWRGIREIEALG
jgi:hypothetical protein